MTYGDQFPQSRRSIEIEPIVTRPVSPDQGRTVYLEWKFEIDLLPNGEEHKAYRDPYRNLQESVERY